MSPELEAEIAEYLDALVGDASDLKRDARSTAHQILTHLSRINSTLSAIDRNLALLEMKE